MEEKLKATIINATIAAVILLITFLNNFHELSVFIVYQGRKYYSLILMTASVTSSSCFMSP